MRNEVWVNLLVLFLGFCFGNLVRTLFVGGLTEKWVAVPAPEGTQLQCWQFQGEVVCQEQSNKEVCDEREVGGPSSGQ